MLHGAAWAAHRDRASALVEDPQQRHLPDWREQRTRRRAELAEKTARRQAEFTALLPAIAAQVAADVSAAVAAALRTTRVGHHEGLHAPTTTSAPTTSVADDHDLNRAPATTTTTAYSSTTGPAPHADIQLARKVDLQPEAFTGAIGAPSSAMAHEADLALTRVAATSATAYAGLESDLTTATPITCSTQCPTRAITVSVPAVTPAATSRVTAGVIHKHGCFDPERAVATSMLDASSARSTTTDSLTHDSNSTTSPATASVRAATSTHVSTVVPVDSTPTSVPAAAAAQELSLSSMTMSLPMGRYCSDQISMEEPLSCLQCVRLQFCCPPGRAKLSGKLFLFLEGAQVDENSLEYTNHCGSETMQWEIAWALKYEYDFLVLLLPERLQFDSLKICILAWLEHSYVFSELTYYCEPWTSWQIQFFVHGTRIAAPIYDLLIELKARDGLEMRLELSMRTDKFASTFCSIILHNMGTCSSLQILERPWFLASCIRPGTPLFIRSYSSLFQLYYTWFGSTTWADQKKYRTAYYIGRIKVPSSLIGTIGNAFICGSSHFQWYIAWSYTLAQAASLITTEALASDPSSVVVRLLAVWISDLIIAKDSFCTTLRTAKQLIGDDISSHQPQCCYMFTTPTFSSSTHCEIIQVNFAIVGIAAWHVFCTRFRPAKVYFLLNTMQYTNKELFQTLVLAFQRVLVVVVVDSALGSLSLHWGLALWNQPGIHFLLGGAAVHYSAWLFQLSIEFVQLVSTSSLQAVALYWFANYHSQYDFELLQWLIAWSLATENGYAVVMVSYLSPHVWGVLSPNGYAGRSTPYGTEQSEWQIAWFLNLKTGTLRYIVVLLSSLETSNFTLLASRMVPWDPGGYATSIGDMQEISLVVQCFNHAVKAANWQAGVHDQHLCLPWDPGDSTRHRLEGKPDFKKGGLSATLLLGLGLNWAGTTGLRLFGNYQLLQILEALDLDGWLWNGRLRPPLLRSPPSSLVRVPLILSRVMA